MQRTVERVLFVAGIMLYVLGLGALFYGLTHFKEIISATTFVMYALVGYYAVWGYKKPHGNLLKYIMLFFALDCLSWIVKDAWNGFYTSIYFRGLVIMAVCYMAGRLNRIEKNKYLTVVIFVLLLAVNVCVPTKEETSGLGLFAVILIANVDVILWFDICCAYFSRFKDHKYAGLIDEKDANELSKEEMATVSNVWMHL